jgi:hypothetical protein
MRYFSVDKQPSKEGQWGTLSKIYPQGEQMFKSFLFG